MSEHILDLTTELEPAKTFTVDGDEYKLLGMEHLSPEEEARATAAFSIFDNLMRKLDRAPNESTAESAAKKVRSQRVKILTMLTTMPVEVATKLPISAQLSLFKAVQQETQDEDGDGDAGEDV